MIFSKQITTRNGKAITLRPPRLEDLDSMLTFANDMVAERKEDPDFGVVFDQKQTRESEAVYLKNLLSDVEAGRVISVMAESDGRIVGSSRIIRGTLSDTRHYGELHISISKGYRNIGLGFQMIHGLLEESSKAGVKVVGLEVFESNKRAIHLYEKIGFKKVGLIPKRIYRNGRFINNVIMTIEI